MPSHKIFLTAFGETKNLYQWATDVHCVVTLDALYQRVKKGWSDEEIIASLPFEKLRKTEKEKRQLKALRKVKEKEERLKKLEIKKLCTLELQVDRAIEAMGQDLKDEDLRNRLRKVTRQYRHHLMKQ